MTQLLLIADDLTGAADAAAPFAARGPTTLIQLGPGDPVAADVLAISTESRHRPVAEAIERVQRAARLATSTSGGAPPLIFKKIDSTLRGHVGPELTALMDALGCGRALIAPAFPAQSRTTRDGRQLLDGIPLEQTEFGLDVATSDIAALVARVNGAPLRCLTLENVRGDPSTLVSLLQAPGIIIADAEHDDDLRRLTQAALLADIRLLCGSAGLAQALAATATFCPAADPSPPHFDEIPTGPILVVAASRHPRTARQIEMAAARAVSIFTVDPGEIAVPRSSPPAVVDMVRAEIGSGRHAVLAVSAPVDAAQPADTIVEGLALAVRQIVEQARPGGLILTGGDTAAAVMSALESNGLWLRGEVEPGIPWGMSYGGLAHGLPLVTKAGGFGHDDSLLTALAHLGRLRQH